MEIISVENLYKNLKPLNVTVYKFRRERRDGYYHTLPHTLPPLSPPDTPARPPRRDETPPPTPTTPGDVPLGLSGRRRLV
ncbi:MAG TPA: hypothetical protein V6C91_01215, partial [Coleofasciculaceae cyanobacterium]